MHPLIVFKIMKVLERQVLFYHSNEDIKTELNNCSPTSYYPEQLLYKNTWYSEHILPSSIFCKTSTSGEALTKPSFIQEMNVFKTSLCSLSQVFGGRGGRGSLKKEMLPLAEINLHMGTAVWYMVENAFSKYSAS